MEDILMEDKKVLLNGIQIFACVRIIKKLNIKDDLVKLFSDLMSNEATAKNLNIEILAKLKDKDPSEENINQLFQKEKDLAKKYSDVQSIQGNLGFELVYLIIEHISYAEDEIFKLLAEVYDEDIEEIKTNPEKGENLIPMIHGIINSASFQKVFTFISK